MPTLIPGEIEHFDREREEIEVFEYKLDVTRSVKTAEARGRRKPTRFELLLDAGSDSA